MSDDAPNSTPPNGRRFNVTLPAWAVSIGKAGIWAAVAIWLLQVMIGMMERDLVVLKKQAQENGEDINGVMVTLTATQAEMRTATTAQFDALARVGRLLYVTCVNNATTLAARDRCEAAIRQP